MGEPTPHPSSLLGGGTLDALRLLELRSGENGSRAGAPPAIRAHRDHRGGHYPPYLIRHGIGSAGASPMHGRLSGAPKAGIEGRAFEAEAELLMGTQN